MTRGPRQPPIWLKGRWADQKSATVTRIAGAVASLRRAGTKITYASICRSVQSLYGISISANTIKRNDAAYELYLANRTSRHYSSSRELTLRTLVQTSTGDERNRLIAKIARFRRMTKDVLIARLLQLEDGRDRQNTTETNLRDEILRLVKNIRGQDGQHPKG